MRSASLRRLSPYGSLASLLLASAFVVPGCGDDTPSSAATTTDVPASPPDAGSMALDVAMVVDVATVDVAVMDGGALTTDIGRDAGSPATLAPGPQTPPSSGRVDMEAWIAAGHYRAWHCEPTPHASRPGSPHGTNRICSNDLLSGSTGDGPYPVGAAAVKELYGTPGTVTGYAVYLKVADGTDGANWYWFERIGARNVADGLGASGSARTICVGCHASAPRDFVFTHVR